MKTTSKRVNQQVLFNIEEQPKESKQKPKNKDDGVFDILDALTAPILTFSQLWADVIPQRLLAQIPLSRMISLMKGQQSANDLECVIYLYTRTLEAPIDRDWVDIYTHISCQTLQDYFNEDHWEDVKAPRELTEWQLQQLNKLRQFIYIKRRKFLSPKNNIETIENNANETPTESQPTKPSIQQGSFEF